jgi:hypothetical protein
MADHRNMKLGKASPRHDPRTLQFANYLRPAELPPPPASVDYGKAVTRPWGMMHNDTVGDCTCAAAGHLIMEWNANVERNVTPSDDDVIAAYAAITGYDPSTGSGDNGAVETDVLNYWRKTGIAGHQIMAYAALEPSNTQHVRDAVDLFGGCYIGLALPVSAQQQDVWSVPPGGTSGDGAPGSWGGHAVPVVAYDNHGLTVITWGATKAMTWEFWSAYCDEAYAVLSEDFLSAGTNGAPTAPNGFDLTALEADLKAVVN